MVPVTQKVKLRVFRVFWEVFLVFFGVFRVLGDVPGFGGVPGCSGVPVYRAPVFLEVLCVISWLSELLT